MFLRNSNWTSGINEPFEYIIMKWIENVVFLLFNLEPLSIQPYIIQCIQTMYEYKV